MRNVFISFAVLSLAGTAAAFGPTKLTNVQQDHVKPQEVPRLDAKGNCPAGWKVIRGTCPPGAMCKMAAPFCAKSTLPVTGGIKCLPGQESYQPVRMCIRAPCAQPARACRPIAGAGGSGCAAGQVMFTQPCFNGCGMRPPSSCRPSAEVIKFWTDAANGFNGDIQKVQRGFCPGVSGYRVNTKVDAACTRAPCRYTCRASPPPP